MQRILVFFLLIELLPTAFYCLSAWQWIEWRAEGSNASLVRQTRFSMHIARFQTICEPKDSS